VPGKIPERCKKEVDDKLGKLCFHPKDKEAIRPKIFPGYACGKKKDKVILLLDNMEIDNNQTRD